MSKSNSDEWQAEGLRDMQTEALQGVLFSMVELGEQSAFLQLEFEGVLHFIAARKLTQAEFDELVRQAVCGKQQT
jgi:hypothetical protein